MSPVVSRIPVMARLFVSVMIWFVIALLSVSYGSGVGWTGSMGCVC